MSEDFEITFQGVDEVSQTIQDIIDKLNELEQEYDENTEDGPNIIVESSQMVPEIEQVMWDVLDKIKARAVEDGAEFLLNNS